MISEDHDPQGRSRNQHRANLRLALTLAVVALCFYAAMLIVGPLS